MSDKIITVGKAWFKIEEYNALMRFRRQQERYMNIFYHLPKEVKEKIYKLRADGYAKTLIEIKSGRFRFVNFLSPMEL